ncbi:hypothetical protein [Neisseria sicca]|nr:hypothetical protein [Neisseria sicca]QMT38311.1 hypothetical protein H3L95_01305 [Neisseria sicca]
MKHLIFFTISVLILAGCDNGDNTVSVPSASEASIAVASSPDLPAKKRGWDYSKRKDEMRNRTTYFAVLQSENEVDIGSPYGSVGLDLAFSINDQNERFPVVMFTLSDGQFDVCHPEGCKVNYKLDDDMIMTIDGMQTSSTNIVGCSERLMEAHGGIGGCMLQNLALYQPIINGAKKLIVEIDIFGYGNAQFKFDVSGLQPWKKWDGLAVPMTY